jgi:hypothetical protein
LTEQAAHPAAEPLPNASDADVAEQHQPAAPDPDAEPESPVSMPLEANSADAYEQQLAVPDLDDYA